MLRCKPIETFIDPLNELGVEERDTLVNKGIYQGLVGKLIYVSHT